MVNPAEVDAVVLVGGMGTRLRPLTLSAPKPMLPTAGLPFLTHLLSRIADAGIEHVVLGTSYKAGVFESEFGDGSKLGLQIDYVVEDEPLGTGGAIANVSEKLRHDTALVFNGDVLSGADLRSLLDSHGNSGADVTLHLVRVGDPRAYGCVPTDSDGVVTAFLEKTQDPPSDQINAGCYVFKREVIERIPKGRALSVEREVFPGLLSDGLRVCGYVDSTYWRDMGTPDDFVRGSADLVRGIAPSPITPSRISARGPMRAPKPMIERSITAPAPTCTPSKITAPSSRAPAPISAPRPTTVPPISSAPGATAAPSCTSFSPR